jgi:PAS domain S-box-containing protein
MSEFTSAHLGRALDCLTDAFVVLDFDCRFTYVNSSAERLLGRPRAALIGRAAWELVSHAIGAEAAARLCTAAGGREPIAFEVLTPGSGRWITAQLFPSDGGIVLCLRDATAQKAAEDALHESEARYRSFFERGLDGMIIGTPSGEVLSVNPAACRLLDRTEAEIREAGRDGLVDVNDPRFEPMLEERERAGYARAEVTVRRKDGTKVPIDAATADFLGPHGQPLVSITLRDLSEQRRVEDRLQLIADAGALLGASLRTEETLDALSRLVVPRMADACLVDLLDASGLHRVGAAHRERRWAEYLMELGSPGPPDAHLGGVFKVARTGEAELVPIVDEAWLRAAGSEERNQKLARVGLLPKSLILVPFRGRAGVLGVLTMGMLGEARCYDALDLSTAQAIADRAALAIENARLYEQTLQAKQLREDVLGIVSHDLRSPLGAIALSAHALAKKTDAREVRVIERAVPRAEALISDLLTAAALDAGSLPLEKHAEDVRTVLEEAVELQRPKAANRSVQLETVIAREIPPVAMDRHRVLEVLGNLLDNALKFTPPGGRVSLEARQRDGVLAVAVSDTGPGIAAEEQQHLFDRFWQGAKQRSAGAGLGLSIAKGIVEAHGGSLRVDSTPGRGATFTFVLPVEG